MNLKQFQQNCSLTANWNEEKRVNFAHFALGIVDETHEITESIMFNDSKLGYEIMDRMWYACNIANLFDLHLADVQYKDVNLTKSIAKIAEMSKKYLAYGKEFDLEELSKHLNNVVYYTNLLCSGFGIDVNEYYQRLIDKLAVRYPGLKFSSSAAIAKADGL